MEVRSNKDPRLVPVAVEGLSRRKHGLKSPSQRQSGKCPEKWEWQEVQAPRRPEIKIYLRDGEADGSQPGVGGRGS